MGELWREISFGLRQFRRSPGLAASVALTIGLGAGANLPVFALLHEIFAGAGGGLLLGRALASQLYSLEPTAPTTLAGAFGGLVLIAVAAAAGPLWRAARIDPASTLHAL